MTPPRSIEVVAAAKINVGWRVTSFRPDGYHEVSGLVQTISLHDRLEITTSRDGPPLSLEVPGHANLESPDNLVCRVAALLSERLEAPATRIVLHKSIPVAAGLGGGSADAAAALVALNTSWGAGLPPDELVSLGAEVGSDVPAILLGGLVHASGRGERVRNVGSFTSGWLVLGLGAEGVAAADAYRVFDEIGSPEPSSLHHNDLEAAACHLVPGLPDRLEAMRSAAGVAFVSGSGPTVVGVASTRERAEGIRDHLRPFFAEILLARPIPWGVRLSLTAHHAGVRQGTPEA